MGKKTKKKSASLATADQPAGYDRELADLTAVIALSRRLVASSVNRELVLLYWQIGAVILRQQQTANWGDSVVEKLAAHLRGAFADMKGLGRDNVFHVRHLAFSLVEIDKWLADSDSQPVSHKKVASSQQNVGTVCPLFTDTPGEPGLTLQHVITGPVILGRTRHLGGGLFVADDY